MKKPDKWIEQVKHIKVLSLTGDLTLWYDKHPEGLENKLEDEKTRDWGWNAALPNLEITCASLCIFDEKTEKYSDTRVYKGKEGYYFKKAGRKYYVNLKQEQAEK
ncbi:hypothetical protein JW756_02050 [Candidatus Woesearchaeota archaeon]|nr:hypothetical protein [Candidatus Woesearchaeota archaeon]